MKPSGGQDYGIIPWTLKVEKAEIRKAPVGSDMELVACYLGLLSTGRSLQALCTIASILAVPAVRVAALQGGSGGGSSRQDIVKGRGFVLLSFSCIDFLITC